MTEAKQDVGKDSEISGVVQTRLSFNGRFRNGTRVSLPATTRDTVYWFLYWLVTPVLYRER